MTDPLRLNRHIRQIGKRQLRRLDEAIGDGTAATVEGSYASIRKGDSEADAISGFAIPPGLVVVAGDHVLFYDIGPFKMVLANLSRNGFVPDELVLADLSIAGRIQRTGILSPPALTANVNDWAPDGWETASIVRIDQTGGPWSIGGLLALPGGVERELHNISTGNLTFTDATSTSAAANRILGPNAANYVLPPNAGATVWYDGITLRWRLRAK